MKRRKMMITTIAGLGALALGAYALKPKKQGANFSPYFKILNDELKNYQRAIPALLVDLDIIDQNIEALKKLIPQNKTFRVVAKSLPSLSLIDYVMEKFPTNKVMVFHQPFLTDLVKKHQANKALDILIGKPFPVKTTEYFYKSVENLDFKTSTQIQWLIDTQERLEQYYQFAKNNGLKISVNLEIDVGLHRGGFKNTEALKEALSFIQKHKETLIFSGFMGYDAHIVKVPPILLSRKKAFDNANNFYKDCIQTLKSDFSDLYHENLTFNGAGSPTVALHNNEVSVLNDIAAGSCLVKPTDFDIDTLEDFKPASFITTPVLKRFTHSELPAIENFKGLMSAWNPNLKQSFFLYGGAWMADYIEPPGLSGNKLFGKSTNQTMVNISENVDLNIGDFVFLRPHQSEFVFLQFGEILTLRNGQIEQQWNLLNQV